jgi:hypothetical protein
MSEQRRFYYEPWTEDDGTEHHSIIDRRTGRAVANAGGWQWALYLVKSMNGEDARREQVAA